MTRILKKILIVVGLIILTISCTSSQSCSHERIINDYFNGLNSGDFNFISTCVADSIMTTEMDFVLTRNLQDLYKQFQWDSVFRPNYSLISLKQDSFGYIATISKTCKRIEFLQDSAMIYDTRIIFKNDKIVKIATIDYKFMDLEKWIPRRDSLSTWVDRNHPEIKGFVNDMTPFGAQNYLKAIDLFRNEK